MQKPFLYLFIAAALIIVQTKLANANGQVEVEVETGPKFDSSDRGNVAACIRNHFSNKFPFDFYAAPSVSKQECPNVEFFDKEFEICWLLDIWHLVEPGILLSMLVFAIYVL